MLVNDWMKWMIANPQTVRWTEGHRSHTDYVSEDYWGQIMNADLLSERKGPYRIKTKWKNSRSEGNNKKIKKEKKKKDPQNLGSKSFLGFTGQGKAAAGTASVSVQ